jgi:hypothetical protein
MVIYQVDGDKSGPTLNNFTVDTAGLSLHVAAV